MADFNHGLDAGYERKEEVRTVRGSYAFHRMTLDFALSHGG